MPRQRQSGHLWRFLQRLTFQLGGCVALLLGSSGLHAQSQNEYLLRAAYVFNLAKYIEWPQPGAEVKIGVIGEGPMGETLEKVLAQKTLGSRPIRVLLAPSDEVLETCDVVYVAQSAAKRHQAMLDHLKGHSILTIGETDAFAREGGVVGLVRVGDQLQIQINLEAARSSQLKVSSRLLNLPTVVLTGGRN